MSFTFAPLSTGLAAECDHDDHSDAPPTLRGRCPVCEYKAPTIERTGNATSNDDGRTFVADGKLSCCNEPGKITLATGTVFGAREDAEMLSGKYGRVY